MFERPISPALGYRARIYGWVVQSDIPLPGEPASDPPEVELASAPPGAQPPFSPGDSTLVYRPPDLSAPSAGAIEFHRQGEWSCLRYTGFVDFYFTGASRLHYFLSGGQPPDLVPAFFLGVVSALLQELASRPCLHASAMQVGDQTIALAGNSGTGKSTLAVALLTHGHKLVSDDILPLAIGRQICLGIPGFPYMKLARDAALRFVREGIPLQAVSPGSDKVWVPLEGSAEFAPQPAPLRVVYLLERDRDERAEIRISPVSAAQALIELLRFSFCARLVERLGLQEGRLATLATVLKYVQVRRLRYPTGLHHLPAVEAAIAGDLNESTRDSHLTVLS